MKKFLSLALALVICLGLTVPALAINCPGDTGISDSASNILQASNPILYSFPVEAAHAAIDCDSLTVTGEQFAWSEPTPWTIGTGQEAVDYLNKNFWPGSDIVYAVPSGTEIVVPDGCILRSLIAMDISLKDGSYSSDSATWYEMTADYYNFNCTVEKDEGEDDAGSLVRVTITNYNDNYVDSYLMLYFTADASAPNPFANVEVPETPGTPAASTGVTFTDVAADAFYAAPVAWAVEKEITKGTSATTFSPNGTCKIEQILTFLWRAAGSPASTAPCPFAGLEQSSPYYPALCWASEKGILKGEATAAGMDCTRKMAVDFMYRYANSPAPASDIAFVDVPADSAASVIWAVATGVTNGTGGGKFSPEKTCTRGEIVTFLFRAFSEK